MVPNIYRAIFSNTLILYQPLCILILNQILLDRLQQQDFSTDETPALLRDLSNILELNHNIDTATVNSKLNLLGWKGVVLDYLSLQLVLACMEMEG